MLNLKTFFCGVTFPTPLILVSGIIHSPQAFLILSKIAEVGGITWKSVSINPRSGHPTPVVIPYSCGFINSVGLKNPGITQAIKEIRLVKRQIHIPLIVSLVAFQFSEFPILAKEIIKANPDLVELNLSCPNVDDEIGRPFATDPLLSALAVQEVKRIVKDVPVIAKLTPNVIDIKEVAKAVENAGADAISAINTLGPGLLIDAKSGKAKLGNKIGGISGKAIKPLALRCVWDIARTVKIPIIGMGGVNSGEDAIEMVRAGATLVGIGSAVFGKGYRIFPQIYQEMVQFMNDNSLDNLSKIRLSVN